MTLRPLTRACVLSIAIFISGCAMWSTEPINSDLYKKYISRSFPFSKKECYRGTLAALKELDISVSKKSYKVGKIITKRSLLLRVVKVEGGQTVASGQEANQYHKYYLKISGNDETCKVAAYKYKVWVNQKPLKEIRASWGKENVWDPFFDTIQEQIEDSELE